MQQTKTGETDKQKGCNKGWVPNIAVLNDVLRVNDYQKKYKQKRFLKFRTVFGQMKTKQKRKNIDNGVGVKSKQG